MRIDDLEQALTYLGTLLLDRKQLYEVVAIGGGGLLLLGTIFRSTKDLDLVALVEDGELIAPVLPQPLSDAIREVGIALNLPSDWINTGPEALLQMGLPDGFKERMQRISYGGLLVHLAGRFDQICFKLYAAADHGTDSKHFKDLQMLKPNQTEIEEAVRWCVTHDVSEPFAGELKKLIAALGG